VISCRFPRLQLHCRPPADWRPQLLSRLLFRSRIVAAPLAAALWLLGAGTGWGHDLGTVQVYGTFFKGGLYRIDVVVDEEHLRAAQAGGPPHATRHGSIARLGEPARSRMGRFLSDLADGSTLTFDGREVSPALEIAAPEPGGPAQRPGRAVLRFSGEIPGGVNGFVWLNRLPLGRYPVVLHNEGEEASIWQWVQGGRPSPPFALAADVVPPPPLPAAQVAARYLRHGFAGVLPEGSAAILFMLGLALLSFRVRPLLAEAAAFAAAYAGGLALAARGGGGGISPLSLAVLPALTLVALAAGNLLECARSPGSRSPGSESSGRMVPGASAGELGASAGAPGTSAGVSGASAGMPGARAGFGALLARLGLVAACGAVQGVAAAGPLLRLGLPRERAVAALAGYGLGAAAALGAVLGAAFLLFGASFRLQPWYRRRVAVPGSILLAAAGLFRSLQIFL
jgi:hypothetical protein